MEGDPSETDENVKSPSNSAAQNGKTVGISRQTVDEQQISTSFGMSLDEDSDRPNQLLPGTVPEIIHVNETPNADEETGDRNISQESRINQTERLNEFTTREESNVKEAFSSHPQDSDTQTIDPEEKPILSQNTSLVSDLTDAAEEQDEDLDQTPSVVSTDTEKERRAARENSDRTSLGFDPTQKSEEKYVDYPLVSTVEIKSVLPVLTSDVILYDVQDEETQNPVEEPGNAISPYSFPAERNAPSNKGMSDSFTPSSAKSYPDTQQEERRDDQSFKVENKSGLSMEFTPSIQLESDALTMYKVGSSKGDTISQTTEEETINTSSGREGLIDTSPNTVQGLDIQELEDSVTPFHEDAMHISTPNLPQEVKSYIVEEALSQTLIVEDLHALPPDFTFDVAEDSGLDHKQTEEETIFPNEVESVNQQATAINPAIISQESKMLKEDIDQCTSTENRAVSGHLGETEQISIESESVPKLQRSYEDSNADIRDNEMVRTENRSQESDNSQPQFSEESQPCVSADTQSYVPANDESLVQELTTEKNEGFAWNIGDKNARPVEAYVTPNIYEEYEKQREEEQNQYEELDLSDTSERDYINNGQSPSYGLGQESEPIPKDFPTDDQIVTTPFPEAEKKQTSTLTYRLMQEQEDLSVYRNTGQLEYNTQSKSLLHRALKATDVSKSAEKLFRDDPLLDESDDDVCYYGEKIVRIVDLIGDGDIKADENVYGADGGTCSFSDIARRVVPLDHAESLRQIDLGRRFAGIKARSEDVIGHQRLHKKESKIFRLLVALRLKKRAHSAADQDQHGSILEVHQRQKETKLIGPETPINERGQPQSREEEQGVEAKPSRWRRITERPTREQRDVVHDHRVSLRDRLMGCLCITA